MKKLGNKGMSLSEAREIYENIMSVVSRHVMDVLNESDSVGNDRQLVYHYSARKMDDVRRNNEMLRRLRSEEFENSDLEISVPAIRGIEFLFNVHIGTHGRCTIGMVEPYVGKEFTGQVDDCIAFMNRCVEKVLEKQDGRK